MRELRLSNHPIDHEIAIGETASEEAKDLIKKAFIRDGIAFRIKFRKTVVFPENDRLMCLARKQCIRPAYLYEIYVNSLQKAAAKASIASVLEDANDVVMYYESDGEFEPPRIGILKYLGDIL